MIYCLNGKVLKKTLDTVVISCAGVGYLAQVPLSTAEAMPAPGMAFFMAMHSAYSTRIPCLLSLFSP